MKLLFPLQNLLRKVRSGAIALPEIEEPIRVELFPGVRENGGQYTHAAIWSVLAFAALGTADKAGEFFAISNPINHARTRAGVHRYKALSWVLSQKTKNGVFACGKSPIFQHPVFGYGPKKWILRQNRPVSSAGQ